MSARAAVAAMTAYTLELREAELKLNQNESPFDIPRAWKQRALERFLDRPWNIYPDFEASLLREALADAYGFDAANILVGNGSNELLAAAVGAFVGPGTPVIVPRPTFTLYEKLVTIAGGLVVPVAIDPEAGTLPLEAMLREAERLPGAVVMLCSPNNPTGGVLPERGLERLLDAGAIVLSDRAYGEFARDTLPELHERLVTFSTFSKAWGLAALRIGWLASDAGTCRQIRKVKLPYSLNILSEAVAASILGERDLMEANLATILEERERMLSAMRALAGIRVFPTEANFIAFRVLRTRGRDLFDALHARGILIRDISGYPTLANCLRVSVGTPQQNDRFLGELASLPEVA